MSSDMSNPDVVEIVRCKYCIHRPYSEDEEPANGLEIHSPDGYDSVCPCFNGSDRWYSYIPEDDFFCAHGARS